MGKKRGRPPKKEEDKLRGYRYNLNLDRDLDEYLHEIAWRKRTSITQYINDLIRADMQLKIAEGKYKIVAITCDSDYVANLLFKLCEGFELEEKIENISKEIIGE